MFKTNLKLIFRNLWKYKGFSFINIAGLSVGMACSILILMWVKFHMGYDKFHENSDNIFRVIQHIKFEDYTTWTITQGPLGPSLKEEVPEIAEYCRFYPSGLRFKKGEENFQEVGMYADPSYYDMFTINILSKLKEKPISEPNNIAISESFAKRYFGDEDPVGEILSALPGREFLITAVFEDFPKQSHVWFDYMIPFVHLGDLGLTIDMWNNSGYRTYVSLKEGVSREEAVSKIEDFLGPKPTLEEFSKLDLQPLEDIHLTTGLDFEGADTMDGKSVKIFLVVGIFLLVIACINFMNLATARSSRRMKEIGMKKVTGAIKNQLINQFLAEAILISFISIILAMMMVELVRPFFNSLTNMGLSLDYGDIRLYLALLGVVVVTGLLAGSYPAFYLASFKPILVLKGSLSETGKKNRFRVSLVIFQFVISIILITSTLIMTKQISYMLNKDLGFDKEGVIYFGMSGGFYDHYEAIKEEMLKYPSVKNMTRAGHLPTRGYSFSNSRFRWEGQDLSVETLFRASFVDYDYFKTLGMEMVDGRAFSKDFISDSTIIINEKAAKSLGFDDPIGKKMWVANRPGSIAIVGVVKDHNFQSLREDIEPQIIIYEPGPSNWALLKVDLKDFDMISEKLTEHWDQYDSSVPINIGFLDESLTRLYDQEKVIRKIVIFFTSIGIFISILGLIGMTGFTMEQKIKEIGIRKALGASYSNIIRLLSSDFLRWIFISFAVSVPITWYFMDKWLDNFAFRINMQWWIFLSGGMMAMIVAYITISIQTNKAAKINPAISLRNE